MTATENGNYTTYQSESGEWYYHPADNDWLAGNHNTDFSRAYATEAEALDDAEIKEQMDEAGEDYVIYDGESGTFRP